MDYIYGKLNFEVEKMYYTGIDTETTETIINNDDLSIQVDVKKTKGILQIKNLEDNKLSLFNGANDLYIELPKVSDKVFQTEFNEFRDYTTNKFDFVETDYNEKITAERERAEENESAIRTDLSEESERAIAEENKKVNIDCPNKLNIAAWKDTDTYVYTVVPSEAEPKLIKVASDRYSGGQTVVQRQNDGNVVVSPAPVYPYHATNKEYVDGIKTALEESITTAVENIGGNISDINDSITQLGEELETTNQNLSNLSDSVDTFKNEFSDFADNVETELDSKADLVDGVVPIFQLPSHVDDDVYFFAKEVSGSNFLQSTIEVEVGEMVFCAAAKATAGEYYRKFLKNTDGTVDGIEIINPILNKLYVNSSSNNVYAWSGSNLVEVSKKLGLGESSTTAYAGNKGKANREDIDKIISGDIEVGKAANSTTSGYAYNADVAEIANSLWFEDAIPSGTFVTLAGDYHKRDNNDFDDSDTYNIFSFTDKWVGGSVEGGFVNTGALYLKVFNSLNGNVTYKIPTATETRAGLISAENNNYLIYLKSVIDKNSGTLNVTGPSVLQGPVTLPTANPLTVFGETHLKNNLFVEGQPTITGKSVDNNPVNTFTISNFLSGEISVKNNLNMLPCGSVYVPTFELPQLTSYTEDLYPVTGDWEAVNKTVLLQFNNHVNAKIRDAISTVEPVKNTANQALNEARNAQADIDALEERTTIMYGSTNQANIQRLYNDERPLNPEVGQIFCLLISDSSFGVVGTQKYLQWDGTEWIELVNKKYVDSNSPKTITISNSFRYGEDIDGNSIEITKDEFDLIIVNPELVSLKLISESGDESRIAHYSGKHFGRHSWLISDAYSGNFYNIEVYSAMEETMKYRISITKVIIGTQVTVDETTGTVSID